MGYSRCPDLKGRFIGYGLPATWAVMLQDEVLKWERNSGPAWTVARLKSLKNDIVREKAGLEPITWVAKNRDGGWKGVIGSLRRRARNSTKAFEMVINCLMCYSSFIPSEPTAAHVEKMRSSVEAKECFIPPSLFSDVAQHALKVVGLLRGGSSRPLLTFQGRVATKAPVYGGKSVPQHLDLEKELDWLNCPDHLNFLERHWQSYSPVLEGLNWTTLRRLGITLPRCEPGDVFWGPNNRLRPSFKAVAAGSLVPLTKDGGWKVRWIASPYRLHQAALNPLGERLFKTLRDLPWDCTFEQDKAYAVIQQHLRSGRMAFAVDLTSATDYFPLSLQTEVLSSLFSRDIHQVELFSELSRSNWNAGKYGSYSWSKGQPMGLYPSFASFALTHGLLLDFLAGGVPGRFFILGDDVVILHQPTYLRYVETMKLLGCPLDPTKSISSNRLTEFAGKIITPERVVSGFKWRDPNSKNFMELMRTFGQSFEPLLRHRERRVYRAVSRLLPPWGCNHSHGETLPLEQVVALTEEFKARMPEACGRAVHTSFLHRLVDLLKPDTSLRLFSGIRWSWFHRKAQELERASCKAFENTPFARMQGDRGPLADFLEVNQPELLLELPALGPRERVDHPSLLEFYEELLGFIQK